MSYLFDQKTAHETACEAAIKAGDSEKAVFHAAKAAEFGFALAEKTGGVIGARHAEDAEGWLEIAERLRRNPLPKGGAGRPGEPQGGGGLQSAVGANGGLEAAAPLAGTRTVVRVGSQEIALRWCPPGSFLKTQREGPVRLALRLADRGAVGIRLPGGDDRRVRRERQPRRDGMVFRQ